MDRRTTKRTQTIGNLNVARTFGTGQHAPRVSRERPCCHASRLHAHNLLPTPQRLAARGFSRASPCAKEFVEDTFRETQLYWWHLKFCEARPRQSRQVRWCVEKIHGLLGSAPELLGI